MPKKHTYPIEAVIFDMDGLMLDTERIAKIAWQRAAADWERTLSDELFAAITGLTARDANTVLQAALGPAFPVEDARQLLAPPVDQSKIVRFEENVRFGMKRHAGS